MFGRDSSVVKKAVVGVLVCVVHCGAAVAQGAAPPPAVTVSPVVEPPGDGNRRFRRPRGRRSTRSTSSRGSRVSSRSAISPKVSRSRPAICCSASSRTPTRRRSISRRPMSPRQRRRRSTPHCSSSAARSSCTTRTFRNPRSTSARPTKRRPKPKCCRPRRCCSRRRSISATPRSARRSMDASGLPIFTVGNLVQPSSGKLATIVSQDPIYVTFPASERDVIAYRHRIAESAGKNPHVPIHIKLPDGTIYPHPGLTNFLDVQVEPNTDTVMVRAQLPNPEGLLIPGGIVGVGWNGAAAIGTGGSAIRHPARPGRPLRPGGRCARKRSSCGG